MQVEFELCMSGGEIEIAQDLSALKAFINFDLGHGFKFLREHNIFCYIFYLEHRLF